MKLLLSKIKQRGGGQTEGGRQELCSSSDRPSRWWERTEKKSRCKSDCEGKQRSGEGGILKARRGKRFQKERHRRECLQTHLSRSSAAKENNNNKKHP